MNIFLWNIRGKMQDYLQGYLQGTVVFACCPLPEKQFDAQDLDGAQ
jgi:hypothetical protein